MPVPETAVHENRQSARDKGDVGPAGNIAPVQPVARRDILERAADSALRPGVARSDGAHVGGAGGGGIGWKVHGPILGPYLERQDRLAV